MDGDGGFTSWLRELVAERFVLATGIGAVVLASLVALSPWYRVPSGDLFLAGLPLFAASYLVALMLAYVVAPIETA